MKIESINVPDVERFPCSKSDAKKFFGDIESLKFSFGRSFLYQHRYEHLKLDGYPVAHASFSTQFGDNSGYVHVFNLRRDLYPEDASRDFVTTVLPRIREWIDRQFSAGDSAPEQREELFVTWLGDKHEFKEWKLKKG